LRRIRIGLAQINPIVGDLAGNVAKIKDYARRAAEAGADLVAYPELCLTGYPPEDLLLKPRFVSDCLEALQDIVEFSREVGETGLVVGAVDRREVLYNAAAVIAKGRLAAVYHKVHLPNYGVFDERRYFTPGAQGLIVTVAGVDVGLSICEDIWFAEGPPQAEAAAGAELLLNINASPYDTGKGENRVAVLAARAARNAAAVAYVNLVGGQDELVFDGHSLVFDRLGRQITAGRRFAEELVVVDMDFDDQVGQPRRGEEPARLPVRRLTLGADATRARKPLKARETPPSMEPDEEVSSALELGVRDYLGKNGFERAVVGLSGGIDSALTAAVAAGAIGPDNVTAVFMPSPFTSQASAEDSTAVARNLGIELLTIPIDRIFQTYLAELSGVFRDRSSDTAEENLQARIRGNILMALSNKFGWLLLSTGNKSETSVGFTTLYGDMSGGFAVLKDVDKTLVFTLARYLNRRHGRPVIPERVLSKEPSAELRPDQKDSDRLPEYGLLDPILKAYVEENRDGREIAAAGFDAETVARVVKMVDGSEYKRRQAPPGPKITARAFGRDWRLPITNRYRG
jgi:NAD+ synthase (glutamine-hydrolysing)